MPPRLWLNSRWANVKPLRDHVSRIWPQRAIAQQPLLLLVIGLGYGVLYYFLFRFVITKWNLRTPGREDDDAVADTNNVLVDQPADDADAAATATSAGGTGSASGPTSA